MSIYNFAPMASMDHNCPFVTWENAFTEEELDKIVEYCDNNLEITKSTLDGDQESSGHIRISDTGWLSINQDSAWIYDRLAYVARKLNAQFYNFDLFGFVEDMQYTIYNGEHSGHYTWHMDISAASPAPRKFTLILQLSNTNDYEGGEIQILNSFAESVVTKQRGLIAAFPSWVMHRVTPVTKGTRKTLVVWVSGPQFK